MRDGTPLPGRTPEQVVSQLAHRVFGPLHPTRTRMVLDYHGLLDHPSGQLVQVAARQHVTTRTVANNTAAVRAAALRLPLSAPLITEAPGCPRRVRITWAGSESPPPWGCPPPRPRRSTTRRWVWCRPGT